MSSGGEAAAGGRPDGAPVPGAGKDADRVRAAARAGEDNEGARGAEEAAGAAAL